MEAMLQIYSEKAAGMAPAVLVLRNLEGLMGKEEGGEKDDGLFFCGGFSLLVRRMWWGGCSDWQIFCFFVSRECNDWMAFNVFEYFEGADESGWASGYFVCDDEGRGED